MYIKMEATSEAITARVRALRKRANLSMDDMARALGYKGASSFQRYENPELYAGGYLKRNLVSAIETAVLDKGDPPIARHEIWELAGPEFVPSPLADPANARLGEPIATLNHKIPVYGHAVGGVDGEFLMNGERLDEVLSPPTLNQTAGAYAVFVAGDSMEPRYFDGEIAYVDPMRRPRKGDFVVAQIQNEEHGPILAYVKRFVSRNSAELVLTQYNPQKTIAFRNDSVQSIHVIVMGGVS